MWAVERNLEQLLLDLYEERVFSIKNSKLIETIDLQNLINKTIYIENLDELYSVIKQLSEGEGVFGPKDAFVCWTLHQSLIFMISLRFSFLQTFDESNLNDASEDYMHWVFTDYMSKFLLGIVNEIIEENMNAMSEFFRKKGFKSLLSRIIRDSKKAYFYVDLHKKIRKVIRYPDLQFDYYTKAKNALQKVAPFAVSDVFEYNWTNDDLEKYYIVTTMFSQKINMVISLLHKSQYFHYEGEQ